MKKGLLFLSVICLALCVQAASANLHWKGPDGVFEEMSSWTENNKVPTAEDFIIVKNYSGVNWSVSFTNDETSWKSELGTPLTNYETLFKLNGHAWALTYDIHMGEPTSGGGRITFTNGTLRAPGLSFVPSVTNNLVLAMKDVVCEVGMMEYGFTRATFEGGILRVTNSLSVGKAGSLAATVTFDKGVKVNVTNDLVVGNASGATGELVNINGQLEHTGADGSFVIGNSGCGALTIQGGSTFINQTPYIGYTNKMGVGLLTVSGGSNTFGKVSAKLLNVGSNGKGNVLAYGGTNFADGISLGWGPGGYGEMLLTNGVWSCPNYSWIGYYGMGVFTITGGQLTSSGVFCVGRGTGTGVVSVAGGTLVVPGELRLGGNATSVGSLTLSGGGVLKAGFISELAADAQSTLLFNGGTLQAMTIGAIIRSVDNVRLTAKGLVLDTSIYAVSVIPTLQDAPGEAGGITKKGAGTLTLAGVRTATGPVSVLVGTLVMSNTVAVSAGSSRIDGTLTLTAGNRLTVGPGAALAGTGTVARVTLQDRAVFARDKVDGALTPLMVNDCMVDGLLTLALTGYGLSDLKTVPLSLISAPVAFVDLGRVTVTLNGKTNACLRAKFLEVSGRQVLSVSYSAGTMVLVR